MTEYPWRPGKREWSGDLAVAYHNAIAANDAKLAAQLLAQAPRDDQDTVDLMTKKTIPVTVEGDIPWVPNDVLVIKDEKWKPVCKAKVEALLEGAPPGKKRYRLRGI